MTWYHIAYLIETSNWPQSTDFKHCKPPLTFASGSKTSLTNRALSRNHATIFNIFIFIPFLNILFQLTLSWWKNWKRRLKLRHKSMCNYTRDRNWASGTLDSSGAFNKFNGSWWVLHHLASTFLQMFLDVFPFAMVCMWYKSCSPFHYIWWNWWMLLVKVF